VVCAYGVGHWQGDTAGQAKVQSQWDKEKAKQMAEYAAAQEAARQRERDMQTSADKIREEKDRAIKEANARNTALLNSLRDRPERSSQSSGMSSTTSTCSGASGAQLARGDGEFLARYSSDAARLAAALDQCIKQYEAIAK
jgi:hypothetical protein